MLEITTVTMRYWPEVFQMHPDEPSRFDFIALGQQVKILVAEMCNTREWPVSPEDVDFVPIPYPPCAITRELVVFMIKTTGHPGQHYRLDRKILTTAKHSILCMLAQDKYHRVLLSPDSRLIQLEFTNPKDVYHI